MDKGAYHLNESAEEHSLAIAFYILLLFLFAMVLLATVYMRDERPCRTSSGRGDSSVVKEELQLSSRRKIMFVEARTRARPKRPMERRAKATILFRHQRRILRNKGGLEQTVWPNFRSLVKISDSQKHGRKTKAENDSKVDVITPVTGSLSHQIDQAPESALLTKFPDLILEEDEGE